MMISANCQNTLVRICTTRFNFLSLQALIFNVKLSSHYPKFVAFSSTNLSKSKRWLSIIAFNPKTVVFDPKAVALKPEFGSFKPETCSRSTLNL